MDWHVLSVRGVASVCQGTEELDADVGVGALWCHDAGVQH